jgi:tetratricopeptide (TPR) repeat protein
LKNIHAGLLVRGRVYSLMTSRATMYLLLLQPGDGLRDAEAAEANGDTDLSNILELEGGAFLLLAGREDLEHAIGLFRLIIELPPPTLTATDQRLYRFDALGNIGIAHYRLGNFEQAISDIESALALLLNSPSTIQLAPQERLHTLRLAYLRIIASNLRLGRINQAAFAARTWFEKSRDPLAQDTASGLESGRLDPQRWLGEYERLPVAPPAQ